MWKDEGEENDNTKPGNQNPRRLQSWDITKRKYTGVDGQTGRQRLKQHNKDQTEDENTRETKKMKTKHKKPKIQKPEAGNH